MQRAEGPICIFVSLISSVKIAGHSPNCNPPPGTVLQGRSRMSTEERDRLPRAASLGLSRRTHVPDSYGILSADLTSRLPHE